MKKSTVITILILILIPLLMMLGGFAWLSYGRIQNPPTAEDKTRAENWNKLRTVHHGLIIYYSKNNNQFPDNLQQLVDTGEITQDQLDRLGSEFYYDDSLDINEAKKFILYSLPDKTGNATAICLDGSVSYRLSPWQSTLKTAP